MGSVKIRKDLIKNKDIPPVIEINDGEEISTYLPRAYMIVTFEHICTLNRYDEFTELIRFKNRVYLIQSIDLEYITSGKSNQ